MCIHGKSEIPHVRSPLLHQDSGKRDFTLYTIFSLSIKTYFLYISN